MNSQNYLDIKLEEKKIMQQKHLCRKKFECLLVERIDVAD